MRGKLQLVPNLRQAVRITPAHAGKTLAANSSSFVSSDHPRACGENSRLPLRYRQKSGSPPRMRGKLQQVDLMCLLLRITPAHAGKTHVVKKVSLHHSDHPRACGENQQTRLRVADSGGSPPRMRGKLQLVPNLRQAVRITPAHAGKTLAANSSSFVSSDHPRACGENSRLPLRYRQKSGSPPRMRGKLQQVDLMCLLLRITPAHAGKTHVVKKVSLHHSDHPRACGENQQTRLRVADSGGSPPRMRGKQGRSSCAGGTPRITPAHAGKTGLEFPVRAGKTDHPRACGENS